MQSGRRVRLTTHLHLVQCLEINRIFPIWFLCEHRQIELLTCWQSQTKDTLKSSDILRSFIDLIILGDSKNIFCLHFKSEAVLRGLFDPDNGGTVILRIVWNYLPSYAAKYPTWLQSITARTSVLSWQKRKLQKISSLFRSFKLSVVSGYARVVLIVHFWKYLHESFLRATYFSRKYGGRI
jgi:hypothetical protein